MKNRAYYGMWFYFVALRFHEIQTGTLSTKWILGFGLLTLLGFALDIASSDSEER
jgi:hypothetical protein